MLNDMENKPEMSDLMKLSLLQHQMRISNGLGAFPLNTLSGMFPAIPPNPLLSQFNILNMLVNAQRSIQPDIQNLLMAQVLASNSLSQYAPLNLGTPKVNAESPSKLTQSPAQSIGTSLNSSLHKSESAFTAVHSEVRKRELDDAKTPEVSPFQQYFFNHEQATKLAIAHLNLTTCFPTHPKIPKLSPSQTNSLQTTPRTNDQLSPETTPSSIQQSPTLSTTSLTTLDRSNNEHKGTIGYTLDAFLMTDGRAKHRSLDSGASVTQRNRYSCNKCGKSYATSSNLSRHKQTHRSLESSQAKPCPHCDKVYVSMPALSMHILTHNLKHKCPVCEKSFSRPWLLQGHLRSHTGEKPYGCAHCGKAFADRSNLRAHMQTHSSSKHYACGACGKTFALRSYLNKHQDAAACGGDCTGAAALIKDA